MSADSDMPALDFLAPDPDLVNRIREGLHAHRARQLTRDVLPGSEAIAGPVPLAARAHRGRLVRATAATAMLRRAAG